MTALAERLCRRYFAHAEHPYDAFEREVRRSLRPQGTLVDAGCGRTAPVLVKFRGRAARLIGIDVVDFTEWVEGVELYQRDLADTGLESGSADVVMARSVMEHVTNPLAVYAEVARVLRPGGVFVASDSLRSDMHEAGHVGDTYNPVDPATLEARLLAAGFAAAAVRRNEHWWAVVATTG